MFGIAFALVASEACEASTRARQVFMRTSGHSCRDYSKEMVGRLKCPGPADFFAAFLDEGNLVEVAFGRAAQPFDRSRSGASWRGSGKVFGDVMEWRVDGTGIPVAAILRTWEVGNDEKTIQMLRVFAINPDGSCQYAAVNAAASGANRVAASEAERASRWTCVGDRNDPKH